MNTEEFSTKFSMKKKKIWVAGNTGMVGQAIERILKKENYILLNSNNIDLRVQTNVLNWMQKNKPDIVYLAAAKVGGILANTQSPVDFIEDNLLISINIIKSSFENKVKKLIYLGSSCIYPKDLNEPIKEDKLLSGSLEETNQWYALAKISGIKVCEAYRKQYGCDFISVLPSNLYGPGDNFQENNSHVPAALIDRFHKAKIKNKKEVIVWGSGNPLREFLYVDDLAEACIYLTKNYSSAKPINIGSGEEVTIKKFSEMVKRIVNFNGKIIFDKTKPDGVYRKLLNLKKIHDLGWRAKTTLENGLKRYYKWYVENYNKLRR